LNGDYFVSYQLRIALTFFTKKVEFLLAIAVKRYQLANIKA
jgi:hypothetical protein